MENVRSALNIRYGPETGTAKDYSSKKNARKV
jgi:hypothetical protein